MRRADRVKINIAYGEGKKAFYLQSSRYLGTLENRKVICKGLGRLLPEAFSKPLGGVTLESVLKGKRRVLVVVPDDTRHAHLKSILPYLLKKIDGKRHAISIIVATGLHKAHGAAQLKRLLGDKVVKKYRVLCHGAGNGAIIRMGRTGNGVPITLDGNLFGHDVVLSIGVIEPHLYAGYSGGAKTVAIGLAGVDTINDTHGVRFLDDPLTAIGSIEHNPFQQALWEIALKTPLRFSVNVVNDQAGRAVKVFCGDTKAVFDKGVGFARRIYETSVSRKADIAICGIGRPKDVNLYQASRAINYVVNVDRPVVRRGGVLIVASELRDGPGTSDTELKFYHTLKSMRSPQALVASVRRNGCKAGEHRAYMVAGALAHYEIVFVSGGNKEFMKGLPFKTFSSIGDAMAHADRITGIGSKIYVIPHALATVARAGGS